MRFFTVFLLSLVLSSCWMVKAYRLRHMNLTDHEKLPYVKVLPSDEPFRFTEASGALPYENLSLELDAELAGTQTAAFLVIRNDSIIYERYFEGFDHNTLLPSNSMAKSFTGTLVSIAIREGKIHSASDPITIYLPELLKKDKNFSRITVQHLLDMRSGLLFNEGRYDIHDDAIKLAMRPNLKKHLLKAKIDGPPGKFHYQSINTQLLGLIIERATGKRYYEYFEEKLWKPMGTERMATLNMDSYKHKQVLASAGLNATPRDFAKLGRLYLQNGILENQTILDEAWVRSVTSPDTMEHYGGYKNQWWSRTAWHSFQDSVDAASFRTVSYYASPVRHEGENYRVNYRMPSFSAIGFLNQAIYVHPEKNLVIVRIGKRWRHQRFNAIQFIHHLAEEL